MPEDIMFQSFILMQMILLMIKRLMQYILQLLPAVHAEYAIAAIKAGKPVYIEKPMAVNYAECLKINKAAEKYNVPVFVAYYRRALPGFLKVKDLIENGSIGKVRFVQIQLFKAPIR